jgi:hypothetical protein
MRVAERGASLKKAALRPRLNNQRTDLPNLMEALMTQYDTGGTGNRQLYGVVIRDRIKSADLATLQAYKTVAHDLLKGGDDAELRGALADLEKAIATKQSKA